MRANPKTAKDVFDGAKLVKFPKDRDYEVGVWHGGHTVNFYSIGYEGELYDGDCKQGIGDIETGEVSRSDALNAILSHFDENTE